MIDLLITIRFILWINGSLLLIFSLQFCFTNQMHLFVESARGRHFKWENYGKGKYSVKSFYNSLRAKAIYYSQLKRFWDLVLFLDSFFGLQSNLSKDLNHRHIKDKDFFFFIGTLMTRKRSTIINNNDSEESTYYIFIIVIK